MRVHKEYVQCCFPTSCVTTQDRDIRKYFYRGIQIKFRKGIRDKMAGCEIQEIDV